MKDISFSEKAQVMTPDSIANTYGGDGTLLSSAQVPSFLICSALFGLKNSIIIHAGFL